MKQSRLESLADGIFAIVMTLLVLEIQVPVLPPFIPDVALFTALKSSIPLFLSYLLSFSLLFTYWRAHHFITSVYAKNIDTKLTNINALFFFFVALIPFSSNLLGHYGQSQLAIFVFAMNIVAIGLSLFWMRRYVTRAVTIENEKVSPTEEAHAYVRILLPVFCAIVAVGLSFLNTTLSLSFFTIAILFNLSRRSTGLIFSPINFLLRRPKE
ncbi:MAG: DUF1211 domain-containing protein [Candidatus Pacebacteria bacterium]|nr:DUF1211 domain-containing protein [Candidatus Paceibacterota bacterium]